MREVATGSYGSKSSERLLNFKFEPKNFLLKIKSRLKHWHGFTLAKEDFSEKMKLKRVILRRKLFYLALSSN